MNAPKIKMKLNNTNVVNALNDSKILKKGCYYKMQYFTFKEVKGQSIKVTISGVYRFGISYQNLQEVKEKYKDVDTSTLKVGALPWGSWKIQNFIIEHKGSYYLRFYPSKGNNGKVKTTYELNGQQVDKQTLLDSGLIKENKPSSCYCLKLENLDFIEVKDI